MSHFYKKRGTKEKRGINENGVPKKRGIIESGAPTKIIYVIEVPHLHALVKNMPCAKFCSSFVFDHVLSCFFSLIIQKMNELENVSDSSDLSDYSPSDDDSELEEDESPIP